MKLTVLVRLTGGAEIYSAGLDVPDFQRKVFEPMHTTDEVLLSAVTGDILEVSEECNTRIETREDTADYLAKVLAKHLVSAMKSNDTHNGYPT